MAETYKLSACFVLHLDAGNDKNGNPRRVYCLHHRLRGLIATVDEGHEGEGAMLGFAVRWHWEEGPEDAVRRKWALQSALSRCTSGRIPTTAAFRRELLAREEQSKTNDLIHGKPTVVIDTLLSDFE